jgi:hypothetical protein
VTDNLSPEYVNDITSRCAIIQDTVFKVKAFKYLTLVWLDELGISAAAVRTRHMELERAGYKWEIARDVAYYEALQKAGYIQ